LGGALASQEDVVHSIQFQGHGLAT
jgi:hypothetical protein